MSSPAFDQQYELDQKQYLANVDFFTWTRHFHVIKDLCAVGQSDFLEVGTGDGVVKRCMQPFVRTYTVMDINAKLRPDVLGDLRTRVPDLQERFDVVIATEILEHLPFTELRTCVGHLNSYLRTGGKLFLTLPHRKGHMLVVPPGQTLWMWRFPIGLTSLSEAYNRFIRRKIWIDPHHCWEIGDGSVTRDQVESVLQQCRFAIERLTELPYCDYWVLQKQSSPE